MVAPAVAGPGLRGMLDVTRVALAAQLYDRVLARLSAALAPPDGSGG